jgi:hypothetical protein
MTLPAFKSMVGSGAPDSARPVAPLLMSPLLFFLGETYLLNNKAWILCAGQTSP